MAGKPIGAVISKAEAERKLDVQREILGGWIVSEDIETYPTTTGGKMRGIDERGFKRLKTLADKYKKAIASA